MHIASVFVTSYIYYIYTHLYPHISVIRLMITIYNIELDLGLI